MHALKALVLAFVGTVAIAVPSALGAAPGNDSFALPLGLSGRTPFVEGTNAEATKEVGEPDHAANAGGASVWYAWSPPADGIATVSTCSSDFDTLLAVYTGNQLPTLSEVAANDDGCGEQSRVSFPATAGVNYSIAVDGFDGATGAIWLTVRLAPPNDGFADAEPLDGDSGSFTATTVGSSWEEGEPDHLGIAWNSIWYTWSAPSSGWATFETCGSPFDTVLAVYTGESLSDLTRVAGNDEACGYASRVHFRAAQGTTYRIALSGYEGQTGDFWLSWNRNAPPPIPVADPRISGTALDGETLVASTGDWDGEPPFTHAFAWGRCDRSFDTCALIEGATSQTYSIRSADVGYLLYVRVTASNASGSTASYSDVTSAVAARAPSNRVPPAITGNATPGAVLVASGGDWIGTAPLALAYQWQSCDSGGGGCTDLVGQTGQVMQLAGATTGRRIRVVVTATNSVGSASAASDATAVVRAPLVRRCVVPNLRGKALAKAKGAIRSGRCSLGRVRKAFSARVRAGRVISQTPRAGTRLAAGARVNLVVSKGKRR